MQGGQKYSGKTALYFEDQPETVQGIVDYLTEKLGFHVIQAVSPQDVFDRLKSHRFDLLILDVRILDGRRRRDGTKQDWRRYGLYFLEELREGRISTSTLKTLPVLVITCVVNTADVEKLQALGIRSGGRYRYLEKPLESLSQVGDAIDYLLSD